MQQQYSPPQQPPYYPAAQPQGLGFGDGFRFGCGFFMAGVIAMLIFYVLLGLIFLLLSMLGVGLSGVFQQMLQGAVLILPSLVIL